MTFETKKGSLDWHEKRPRTLTKEFIDCINWKDVKNHPVLTQILCGIIRGESAHTHFTEASRGWN